MKVVTDAIATLTAERDKLDQAILALGHLNNFANANVEVTAETLTPRNRGGKRKFSPAARAKMRDAQRRRWAAWRKEQKRG